MGRCTEPMAFFILKAPGAGTPGAFMLEETVLTTSSNLEPLNPVTLSPPPSVPVKKSPFSLTSRQYQTEDTVIRIGGAQVGGGSFAVIAGPCSIESSEQLQETAIAVKSAGATMLRGGAFKPRTSPYSFQGLGELGLKLLAATRESVGLPVVTEVMDSSELPMVERYADVLQIGSRNSQNFSLLKRVGLSKKPVVLKRGLMTTIDEFLNSAEYILAAGNPQVILCERGIRTFETATRNTLDLSAVCVLKERTHLPVIVDPSHATGFRRFVKPLTRAAMAVGADGVMIEVHCSPENALCDGDQSLTPTDFEQLMKDLGIMSSFMNQLS